MAGRSRDVLGVRRAQRPGLDAVSCCGSRKNTSSDNDWAYINYSQVPLTGPGDYLGAGHWSDPEESMIDWDALRLFLKRCGCLLLCAVVVAAVTWPFISRRFDKTEDEARRTSVGMEAEEPAPLPAPTEPGAAHGAWTDPPSTSSTGLRSTSSSTAPTSTSSSTAPTSTSSSTAPTSTSSSTTATTPAAASSATSTAAAATAAAAGGGGPPPGASGGAAAPAAVPDASAAPSALAAPAGCAAECAVGSSEPRGAGWDSTPSSGTCAALVRQWAQGYGGGSPCVRAYVSVLERCPQCGSCPFSAAGCAAAPAPAAPAPLARPQAAAPAPTAPQAQGYGGPPPRPGGGSGGLGTGSTASCAAYGCRDFDRSQDCQCNPACEEHRSCCPDYGEHCARGNSTPPPPADGRQEALLEPRLRGCESACPLAGVIDSCAKQVDGQTKRTFAGRPNACLLAYSAVLQECPSCSMCSYASLDCAGG